MTLAEGEAEQESRPSLDLLIHSFRLGNKLFSVCKQINMFRRK